MVFPDMVSTPPIPVNTPDIKELKSLSIVFITTIPIINNEIPKSLFLFIFFYLYAPVIKGDGLAF